MSVYISTSDNMLSPNFNYDPIIKTISNLALHTETTLPNKLAFTLSYEAAISQFNYTRVSQAYMHPVNFLKVKLGQYIELRILF